MPGNQPQTSSTRERLPIDLRSLAVNRLGLTKGYSPAQYIRLLKSGIQELEERWHLQPLSPAKRFIKISRTEWDIRFICTARKEKSSTKLKISELSHQQNLVYLQLEKRGVDGRTAIDLVSEFPLPTITQMVQLFDWYNSNRQKRGAGFLIDSIKNRDRIQLPADFPSRGTINPQNPPSEFRNRPRRLFSDPNDLSNDQAAKTRHRAFWAFWRETPEHERSAFETASFESADSFSKSGYNRAVAQGGKLQEIYRLKMLMDHFERNQKSKK